MLPFVVTAHVHHVVGFSISTVFQVSSLDQNVVDLLLGPFRRSVGRLLSMCFSVHRVECCEVLYHQSLLLSISSFVFSLSVCGSTLARSTPSPGPSSALKSPPTNLCALLTGIRVLLDCSVHFFNVMIGIHRVVKVHAHQLDAMKVDRDRDSDSPFIDVFSQ